MRNIKGFRKNDSADSNEVTLVKSGSDFFSTLEKIINEAAHFIHFQTYIFEEDETGRKIQQALMNAATRKVKVFLVLDAYGSSALSEKFVEEMKAAGIHFRFFGPLLSQWKFHLGRRMHHKIVVVDAALSLVGGINIGDRYNNLENNIAWLDFAVLSRGPVSLDLLAICIHRWSRKKIHHLPKEMLHIYKNTFHPKADGSFAYARENDALGNKTQITAVYKKAIRAASHEIIFAGGYFIPGFRFRKLLKSAAGKGVKIKIITGSKSDVGLAINAIHFLYEWMLKHKFEIYEYQKSIVHAKVTVVDGEWATVGSYDLNNLSAYTNIEANVDVHANAFAQHVHSVFLKIIEDDCVQITPEYFKKKTTWLTKMKWWGSYRIVRFLFSFSKLLFTGKGD